MVSRKVNIGVGKVVGNNLFWLNNHGARWPCRMCNALQPPESFSLELALAIKSSVIKVHVCHACAVKLFDDALTRFTLLKNHGPDGYRLLMEIN